MDIEGDQQLDSIAILDGNSLEIISIFTSSVDLSTFVLNSTITTQDQVQVMLVDSPDGESAPTFFFSHAVSNILFLSGCDQTFFITHVIDVLLVPS